MDVSFQPLGTGPNKMSAQVSFISHLCPRARSSWHGGVQSQWSLETHVMTLPGHSLDVTYCAGSLQRYHYHFVPYKEDICCLHYKACVEWDEGAGPSKNRSWKRSKRKKKAVFFHGVPSVSLSPEQSPNQSGGRGHVGILKGTFQADGIAKIKASRQWSIAEGYEEDCGSQWGGHWAGVEKARREMSELIRSKM